MRTKEQKLVSPTLNMWLGEISIAQKRRAAYEKAVTKSGQRSFSAWAKIHLDKAAGFKE